MDTTVVARNLQKLIDKSTLPDKHNEYGKNHLNYMLNKLIVGEVSGEKAHRWIGWAQGCICMGGGATLEEMKRINEQA